MLVRALSDKKNGVGSAPWMLIDFNGNFNWNYMKIAALYRHVFE
jgi:hypothetical protein